MLIGLSQMSRLSVFTLLLLLFGFEAAHALTPVPVCLPSWEWTYNSLSQNPCQVAQYLMATCYGGGFNIPKLMPGLYYPGPTEPINGTSCACSPVTYNLLSACAACQGAEVIWWSDYSWNCTDIPSGVFFPNPVPSGTYVPQWGIAGVTKNGIWQANECYTIGNTPEIGPGTLIGSSNSSSSNVGAIVGGIIGGIAAVVAAGLAIWIWRRRKHRQAKSALVANGVQQPSMGDDRTPGSDTGTPLQPLTSGTTTNMKFYDPNDPSTFPVLQGARSTPEVQDSSGSGHAPSSNIAQSSYRGFPAV
ncbi:hypothetical protein BGW80DRAFT_176096 [Lactifluus volemus]|nr:hypothetical protein BGW80DRAFT_176096 [Lactifluus volemus]